MNPASRARFFFLLSILFATGLAAADRERIPVTLKVECDDNVLKGELTSFLSRELRAVPDVDLFVDPPPRGGLVSFDVVAVPTCGNLGVAVSYGVHERYYPDAAQPYIEMYLGNGVHTDSRSDIKGLAQRVVAAFDSSALNEWRRQTEDFHRALANMPQPAPSKPTRKKH